MAVSKPLVVIVTGAGRGTGRELAEAFAANGAFVAANDIAPNNVGAMVKELSKKGYTMKAYVEDVAKKMAAQALINRVIEDWGRVDVLVNHAFVEPHMPLLDMDEWDWHRTMDVNLTGSFLMLQSAARVMREQGGGVIINLLSLTGQTGALDRAAYVSSQMGIIGLTRQAARELYTHGVRVHAVGKGIAKYQNAEATVPSDLIRAVLFLASPRAAHLTGMIVNIP